MADLKQVYSARRYEYGLHFSKRFYTVKCFHSREQYKNKNTWFIIIEEVVLINYNGDINKHLLNRCFKTLIILFLKINPREITILFFCLLLELFHSTRYQFLWLCRPFTTPIWIFQSILVGTFNFLLSYSMSLFVFDALAELGIVYPWTTTWNIK